MGLRLWIAVLALAGLFLAFGVGGGAGVTIGSVDARTTYEVSSSAVGLLGTVLIGMAYIITLTLPPVGTMDQLAGTGRRAAAWFIDFSVSLTAFTTVLALIPLTIEAIATGHFEWLFQRTDITAGDWVVAFVVVALAFVGMGFYWAVPVMRGSQTVGQCVFGLRVMPATPHPPSLGRVWVRGFLQPFAGVLWLGKLLTGKYWHDQFANTKVVCILDRATAAA